MTTIDTQPEMIPRYDRMAATAAGGNATAMIWTVLAHSHWRIVAAGDLGFEWFAAEFAW